MASKYYNFNIFMAEVVETADRQYDLESFFALTNNDVMTIITMILTKGGWRAFLAVVALLLLGPAAFIAALAVFHTTPPGWIFTAIFGAVAIPTIHILYKNRELPILIKEVGEEFKPKWKRIEGDRVKIDNLLDEAIATLVRKAKLKQRTMLKLDN